MFGPTDRQLLAETEETEDEETQDDDSETGPIGPGPFDGPGFAC